MGSSRYQTDGDPRTSGPGFGLAIHPETLRLPSTWRSPRLVFVNSMSDLFHPKVPASFVKDVFQVMEATPRHTFQLLTKRSKRLLALASDLPWPSNLWMGVSVENDDYSFRAEHLRSVPAAVRFVSAEPLLGPLTSLELADIDWLIAGGESGIGARCVDADWARDLRDRCHDSGVAFFFKQWGGRTPKAGGRLLDGRIWDEFPVRATALAFQQERIAGGSG
jgi:protein gp37